MDILKQSKFLLIIKISLLCILFVECDNSKKNSYSNDCYNDSIIHLRQTQEKISIIFTGNYRNENLKDLTIQQINKTGKENLDYEILNNFSDNTIQLKNKLSISYNDSIIVSFNNKNKIKLYNFRNTPHYGGKKMIGCYLGYCILKNDTIVAVNGDLYLK
ncbi:hypothetical protein NAL32_21520 [Chryseobacterium sp. Ch-15]|uniref:Uncharacterized protein n=1 Tax=Chryseobacterium muglaense TaxID=2893752 RepID=A0A9Q3UXQ1_9FLAO|nr:hypothetical protein [Chryseobacterium muglaense]MBD3907301.1 hypothetical protein [Chryseobacterium muglaense]MCC9036512.1 hypothetical protein [Chryseobacterium muglaense]MCM2556972.1 hypothetical protein [Chryseobacterium muglaense]